MLVAAVIALFTVGSLDHWAFILLQNKQNAIVDTVKMGIRILTICPPVVRDGWLTEPKRDHSLSLQTRTRNKKLRERTRQRKIFPTLSGRSVQITKAVLTLLSTLFEGEIGGLKESSKCFSV